MVKSSKVRKNILTRLRKVEGQISGLKKMIEKDASCSDILIQISAARAAVGKIGMLIMQNYMRDCFINQDKEVFEDKLEELTESFSKFIR